MEKGKGDASTSVARQLFTKQVTNEGQTVKKRKTKGSGASQFSTPDLNKPAETQTTLVPVGLVTSRLTQFVGEPDATTKKQKMSETNAQSAAAADGSPRRAQ
jgi:hypothetical protein